MITKNIRTHVGVLKDGRRLNLTFNQYEYLRDLKNDTKIRVSTIVTLQDPDNNNIIYDGEVGQIREFIETKEVSSKITYTCGYGSKHDFRIKCNCIDKFEVIVPVFREWLKKAGELNPNLIVYPKNITENHQRVFLENFDFIGYRKKQLETLELYKKKIQAKNYTKTLFKRT